jgi:hypothetical protein
MVTITSFCCSFSASLANKNGKFGPKKEQAAVTVVGHTIWRFFTGNAGLLLFRWHYKFMSSLICRNLWQNWKTGMKHQHLSFSRSVFGRDLRPQKVFYDRFMITNKSVIAGL